MVAQLVILGWKMNPPIEHAEHPVTTDELGVALLAEEESSLEDGDPQSRQEQDTQPSVVDHHEDTVHQSPLVERNFLQQIRTFEYFFITMVASTHVLRSNFYLGTVSAMLESLGDADHMYATTKAVGYIIPCGFFVIPFIGATVKRFGLAGSIQVVNVLGITYNCLNLIPNLSVQIIGACVYTTYRAYVFSIIATFNAQVFGLHTMGRIQGVMFLLAGVANLSMNPIVAYTQKDLQGDFSWPIVFQIAMVAP
eukprot:5799265-Pyramimonas_sp.AAC.1